MVYTGNPVIKVSSSVTWKKENDLTHLWTWKDSLRSKNAKSIALNCP